MKMRRAKEEKDNGIPSSGSRLRRKKKNTPRKELDATASSTSCSSLEDLRDSGDQATMNARQKRSSDATIISIDPSAIFSSRGAHDSAMLNDSGLSNDKNLDENGASINYADSLNNSKDFVDIAETPIKSSKTLWIKDIITKTSQGRSARGSRSGRARTQRRGSNSIRSTGSQNVSRSSHASISIHTMASSMDSSTDSELEHEILSDDVSVDNDDQDLEYLTESESEDDIGEYDSIRQAKSDRISKKSEKAMLSTTSPSENSDAKDKNNNVGGILRNGYTSKAARSKFAKRYREKTSGPGNQSTDVTQTQLDLAPQKRQVLWAEHLKEEYSHRSVNSVRKDAMIQDYEMPLKKMPPPVLKRNSAELYFEMMQQSTENATDPKGKRRGSLSEESLDTLNSSNRQDSFSDFFEAESSFSVTQRSYSVSLRASFSSQSSSNLVDSGRDSRIVELMSGSVSNHQTSRIASINVPPSDDKRGTIDWEKVNQKLNSRGRQNYDAMERGVRYSFETDVELSEDFYDCFFLPREEATPAESSGILGVGKVWQKSTKKQSGEDGTTSGRNPSIGSHLDYSISQSFGFIGSEDSITTEKMIPLSSDRIRQYIVRGICAFLIVLTCGLLTYFFLRSDIFDESYPAEIDVLFEVDP